MRIVTASTCTSIFLAATIVLLTNCTKNSEGEEPLPVINPTTNPIPFSTLIYLIKPTDKSWNASYYNAAKSSILEIKDWYQGQLGKTFILNPVIIDTLSGSHDALWYDSNHGDSVAGDAHAYFNIRSELKQLLGVRYDTTMYRFFAFVQADFPEQTLPGSLGVEGETTLEGLTGSNAKSWKGSCAHALGHAFGLKDRNPPNATALMSDGRWKYPSCTISQAEKDSLNLLPFLQ